jgi:serine/threonine protein kinase
VVSVLGISNSPTTPMLVMEYLENKSLYEVLHSTEFQFEQDSLLAMVSDVVAGMTFLHGHDPIIVHGHLSSMVCQWNSGVSSCVVVYVSCIV